MRIITANVNGIRSAAKKGFFHWFKQQNADVLCLQELKAQHDVLQHELFQPAGYHAYFHPAEKKGYSGVGIYTKHKPLNVKIGLGWPDFDQEGRYLEVDFGKLRVVSLYLPSGTSGEIRQAVKFDFLKRFTDHLMELRKDTSDTVICGDWNIAHKAIDLKNWRSNQKNSGFLPAERAWLDTVFDTLEFVDAFRHINKESDQYTWWSNRGKAREKNVGWRIDYQVVTPGLKETIESVMIYKDERFSDHAPLLIDYKYKI